MTPKQNDCGGLANTLRIAYNGQSKQVTSFKDTFRNEYAQNDSNQCGRCIDISSILQYSLCIVQWSLIKYIYCLLLVIIRLPQLNYLTRLTKRRRIREEKRMKSFHIELRYQHRHISYCNWGDDNIRNCLITLSWDTMKCVQHSTNYIHPLSLSLNFSGNA